jgi:hypothetical protein
VALILSYMYGEIFWLSLRKGGREVMYMWIASIIFIIIFNCRLSVGWVLYNACVCANFDVCSLSKTWNEILSKIGIKHYKPKPGNLFLVVKLSHLTSYICLCCMLFFVKRRKFWRFVFSHKHVQFAIMNKYM